MNTKVYFENIENILLEELSKANNTVFLLVAWLTNKKLFAKLVELAEKGVQVKVIINKDDINKNSFLDYSRLNIGTSSLYMLEPNNGNIIHHKFCIIDDYTIINGSYNWTFKANYNHENINIIKNNKDSIIKYKNEFKKILPNAIQESKLSNNNKANKQIGVESSVYVLSEAEKQEYEEWYKWQEEESKKFSTWFDNQNYYDLEFVGYLNRLNEEIYYSGFYTDVELLQEFMKELLAFYDSKFNIKHPSFFKYLLHITIDAFKINLESNRNDIKPYFRNEVKDIIYQDRFYNSINAYQYKLTLILIMLDFAYEDFEFNGILYEPSYGYNIDYTKEPKVYSSEITKKLEFIRDVKLDDFKYKITDQGILEINNCIRYFSNEKYKTYSEEEELEFVIQALKDKELNRNIYDSELEFSDIIVKMKVNKFNTITKVLKENGLVNSFELAKTITEINMNIDNLDFAINESELKILIRNFIEEKDIIKNIILWHEPSEV